MQKSRVAQLTTTGMLGSAHLYPFHMFDIALIVVLICSILERSIAIGQRLEARSYEGHMVAGRGSHCSCLPVAASHSPTCPWSQ